ncbi:glycosyltransferase [Lentzea sp. NPDC059081]|uniref:glycosyltransferase n=1 Tax=Lentzea sp. NPDC059081 TaxID=3346719 RepID=UPI00369FD92E
MVDGQDDCFAVGDVNHQRLFGELAAVVHHGGAGTVQTAAGAGVPQVAVPIQVGDNPYWAGRVSARGIGATTDRARTAARLLLDSLAGPSVRGAGPAGP